jgi:hypothetical protein
MFLLIAFVFNLFPGLKYGGPSATLLKEEIQSIDHSGCDIKDHLVAAGKIAVIEGDSQDCDLWTAASYAEEVRVMQRVMGSLCCTGV